MVLKVDAIIDFNNYLVKAKTYAEVNRAMKLFDERIIEIEETGN